MLFGRALLFHEFSLSLFKSLIWLSRFLPATWGEWLFFFLRSTVVCSFGFSSWLGEFIKSDTCSLLCVGVTLVVVQLCTKFYEKRSMDVSVNMANSLLEQDVLAHQNICATLEHLKQALKTKSLIEKEAEATFVKNKVDKNLFFEALKKDLMNLEKSNEALKLENEELKSSVYKMDWQVKEMNDTIADSESQLLAKDAEKEDLEKELQKEKQLRQETDEVVQNVQSELEKEKRLNVGKNADISNLSVECERLALKKEELLSELLALRTRMKEMQLQNEKVKRELKIQKEEKNKIEETNKGNKEIQKFTEELKVQLTSAKGRLSRVGSVLGDGPESALRATPTLEFNE